jgi:hypothetical protein
MTLSPESHAQWLVQTSTNLVNRPPFLPVTGADGTLTNFDHDVTNRPWKFHRII